MEKEIQSVLIGTLHPERHVRLTTLGITHVYCDTTFTDGTFEEIPIANFLRRFPEYCKEHHIS